MDVRKLLLLLLFALGLTACAEMQVKRDLQHAEDAARYQAAVAKPAAYAATENCAAAPALNAWQEMEFTSTTTIYKINDKINAAAYCFKIPPGSRSLEILSSSRGGMTYYELTLAHPSLLFVGGSGETVSDFQKPNLHAGEGIFRGLGLSGIVVLTTDLSVAKQVVVYVHPLSLKGAIDVQTGFQSIPVPYSPYGNVRIKFRP